MDAAIISLRWQNIFAIWIMAIALGFIAVAITQMARRFMSSDTTSGSVAWATGDYA